MMKHWREWKGTVAFLFLMVVFRSAVADWNYIPSDSMNPTLIAGDRVLVNKLAYSLRLPLTKVHLSTWAQPQAGDVVTFDSPQDELNLIKRVVGVAGDEVAMWDNQLIINGRPVPRQLQGTQAIPTERGRLQLEIWRESQPSADGVVVHSVAQWPARNQFSSFQPVVVPEGHILVLGDSRDNSNDSRFIGMIAVSRVTGRAERVVMSHDPQAAYLPRAQRWWVPMHF